jgi:hypothetical protein
MFCVYVYIIQMVFNYHNRIYVPLSPVADPEISKTGTHHQRTKTHQSYGYSLALIYKFRAKKGTSRAPLWIRHWPNLCKCPVYIYKNRPVLQSLQTWRNNYDWHTSCSVVVYSFYIVKNKRFKLYLVMNCPDGELSRVPLNLWSYMTCFDTAWTLYLFNSSEKKPPKTIKQWLGRFNGNSIRFSSIQHDYILFDFSIDEVHFVLLQ